jgi:hypothetical protein
MQRPFSQMEELRLLTRNYAKTGICFLMPLDPIGDETVLSRIFAFSSESAHNDLICSPCEKRKARALLIAAK